MTTSPTPRLRRRQRIASDEAHAWARHLRFGNAYAKSVLLALTHYVNDEGACTAGLPTLAEDTDLSVDTVRKRIRFLEDCGAIARFPRWIDERGRVNNDGRGKQTTDEIRLMLDADPEVIEARARGDVGDVEDVVTVAPDGGGATTVSPSCQQGLNHGAESVRGGLGVGQGSLCGNPLDSFEPEPEESPPTPPSGGVCDEDREETSQESDRTREPEHFAEFFEACPGWRTQARDRVRQAFEALTPEERVKARAAAPLNARECEKARKKSRDAWKLIREKFWVNFPDAKLPEKPPPLVWIDVGETDGLAVALEIADGRPLNLISGSSGARGLWRRSPIPPDLAALATFAGTVRDDWPIVPAGSHEFAAWRARLEAWTGLRVEGQRVFTEPHDRQVHDLPPTHPAFRLRRSIIALRVPCRWPPRRDGTLVDSGEQADQRRRESGSAA